LNEILEGYHAVSESLADEFFAELQSGIAKACAQPRFFHFDTSGLRRCNLERFPYHFLYDIQLDGIRVWVVRHDRRNPRFGLRRFVR
jgi:plasmid stabilization system protein ParE